MDDIVMMYPKERSEEWKKLHDALIKRYEMKDMGELKWFLGIEVIRNRKTKELWSSQESYLSTVAHRFHQRPRTYQFQRIR